LRPSTATWILLEPSWDTGLGSSSTILVGISEQPRFVGWLWASRGQGTRRAGGTQRAWLFSKKELKGEGYQPSELKADLPFLLSAGPPSILLSLAPGNLIPPCCWVGDRETLSWFGATGQAHIFKTRKMSRPQDGVLKVGRDWTARSI
jgi:hypothetical protein